MPAPVWLELDDLARIESGSGPSRLDAVADALLRLVLKRNDFEVDEQGAVRRRPQKTFALTGAVGWRPGSRADNRHDRIWL